MKTKTFDHVLSSPGNPRGLSIPSILCAIFGVLSLFCGHTFAQQPAILGATSASNRAVVFPDANTPATQNLVPGLPANAAPHGVAYFGSDNALLSDFANSRVHVVQISTASLVSTINTAPTYDGTGTIVVAPNLTVALAMGSSATLNVIQGPFGPASTLTQLTMPGIINGYQTQAIVFNNAGRAFVYHSTGISVLDAPYNAIAFTIPVAGNGNTGAIAIAPDGSTLLTTSLSGNLVRIFQAPFSAASTSTTLTIPGGNGLDGIMVAPNGGSAIVVSGFTHHAAAITAPFSASSVVETLSLPAGSNGFEDVGISADSQIAILTGNSTVEPPVFVRAPFTAAGAVITNVPLQGVANPARGNGAVRFLPPGLAPGLTISKSAPATVASGANLTYTISYANTGTANATNVVISDPLPVGTSFVSATNGGSLIAGNVVFNIGTVLAGAATQTVSFTVTVNTAEGGTVENNNYTIAADGVAPIAGPPVSTVVTAGQAEFRCPLSHGYWKNHATWPVTSLMLGTQTYTQTELVNLLRTPAGGKGGTDASLILAYQLIAAKLNLANGSDPAPISSVIADADALLAGFGGKLPYGVKASSATGQAMVGAAGVLESYNTGASSPICIP